MMLICTQSVRALAHHTHEWGNLFNPQLGARWRPGLLSQSDHFGGGYFDDKKIRVGDSGGGPDDNDIWTKTAALDLMTQATAPNQASPRLVMTASTSRRLTSQ